MEHDQKQPDLLDDLARRVGCDVLSDLHCPRYRAALQRAVRQIPPERYGAAQWREALDYLLFPSFSGGRPP